MTNLVMRPMAWSGLPDVDSVKPLQDSDQEVLDELNAVLRKHGYTERFGIFLLHRHFHLDEGEILVEYTDIAERTQTIVVDKATPENKTNFLQTAWKFDADQPQAVTVCELFCHNNNGHVLRHKRVAR